MSENVNFWFRVVYKHVCLLVQSHKFGTIIMFTTPKFEKKNKVFAMCNGTIFVIHDVTYVVRKDIRM